MAFLFFMGTKLTRDYRYHHKILLGLFFSSAGDALLDYKGKDLFPFGMLAFAVAQIFYIWAFGWKPLRFVIGVAGFVFGGLGGKTFYEN